MTHIANSRTRLHTLHALMPVQNAPKPAKNASQRVCKNLMFKQEQA